MCVIYAQTHKHKRNPFAGRWHCKGRSDAGGAPPTPEFDALQNCQGVTVCTVTELVDDSSVENDDSGCEALGVTLGEGAACTITNTRFFEGIPTLSRLNLALLALLLALTGWIGIRRFA